MVSAPSFSLSEIEDQVDDQTIRCPSCDTSFQIQGTFFTGGRNPRFHCTVCDCIFIPHSGENSAREYSHDANTDLENDESTSSPQPTLSGTSTAWRSHSIDKSFSGARRQTDTSASPENSSESLAPYEFPSTYKNDSSPRPPFENEDVNEEGGSGKDIRSVGGRLLTVRRAEDPYALVGRQELKGRLTANRPPLFRSLRPFFVFFTTLSLLLALITSVFTLNADTAEVLGPVLFSKGANLPPAGMVIEDAVYQPVRLEDGGVVTTVSGVVANLTQDSFRRVSVQGLSFDAAGTIVGSGVAVAGSQLTDSRLAALSGERLRALGEMPGSEGISLKPGERKKFVVLLEATEEARELGLSERSGVYYSARVYLVH